MKADKKKSVRRWLLLVGAAVALGTGAAYALPAECWDCQPCGCGADGGYIMCCDAYAC